MRRDRPAPTKPSAEFNPDKDKMLAEFRDTKWYQRGEQIVERVRKRIGGGYSPAKIRERVVEAIPKYARKLGGSGAIGPPDVRKSTERTMIGKRRKPGEWGGAGR